MSTLLFWYDRTSTIEDRDLVEQTGSLIRRPLRPSSLPARASQEHQLRRSDRFSGIAAWTLSSAEAFAGGAVFLLLAGMSRDTRQGEGERESSSGRSSRIVVEGGRPGSAREAKVVGQTA